MRWISYVCALALAALPLSATSQALAAPADSVLTVGGNGTVGRSPDLARLALDVVTDDALAARSGGKNTTIYNALVARVAALGIAAADVRTTSYNVAYVPFPPKELPPDQRQSRYGYVTTRSLSVLVTPLENVGKVVDAATAAGVTQIAGVSFELRDRSGAYLAALAAAMRDARQTAAALAAAGDLHIVRIRTVTTGYEPVTEPGPLPMRRMSLGAASEAPTEIAPNGPIDVTAHVTVTYDIK